MRPLYLFVSPISESSLLASVADITSITAACSLAKVPGKNNWIEYSSKGSLPNYICRVAKAIHEEHGYPISKSISIAIGVIRDWATGRHKVNADTRTKAAAAIAQWEAMKAEAKAKRAKRGR
jgi:hypothetical protein